MLDRRNQSLADLVQILKIYRDNVGDEDDMDETNEINSKKAILSGLLGFLEGSI
jgi:hypothetical protein